MMLLLLFLRLFYVFRDTVHCLSKTSIRIYTGLFIFLSIFYGSAIAQNGDWQSLFLFIVVIIGWIYIVLFSLSISILFIRKLLCVANHTNVNESLMNVVTKRCILASISSVITALSP